VKFNVLLEVIIALQNCFLLWDIFFRHESVQWGKLAFSFASLLVLLLIVFLNYKAARANVHTAAVAAVPQKREERRTFLFSPGIAVSLSRGAEGATVFVQLHILSTEPTELIYIRIILTDSTGLRITCEHSEPLRVDKFELTAKTIEQKITQQELGKFERGMLLSLNGYAKFRYGSNITQQQISSTTIPNL